jgi:hypothetical protein
MRRIRTTPILVIAILHLTGGTVGLLSSICTCGSLLIVDSFSSLMPAPPTFPTRPGQPSPLLTPPNANEVMKYLNDNVPGFRAFTIGGLAISFLLDILLLSAGIGLLKMQPWARWLSLVYAAISILFRVGSFIYQLGWVLPATQALYAKFMAATGLSSLMIISSGAGAVGTLLVVIYPIAVIIVMLLPSTAAAFRGELPVRNDDRNENEEEEYDEDRWREPPPPRSDKFRP